MTADYMRALKWPVLGWIAVDALFILVKFIDGTAGFLDDVSVAVALTLAFGIWAGLSIVRFGGRPVDILGAGLVVGIVCAAGSVLENFIHLPSTPTGAQLLTTVAVSLVMNVFGAIIGGGYALSQARAAPKG